MRIRLPQMIQDPDISALEIGRLVEDWTLLDEDHYLDGPVTPRVAVIDLDPTTEQLEPGAVFLPPEGGRTLGAYRADKSKITSNHFIQVSVFATVYRTIYLFERPDTLGRRIAWGFGGPQLLVVPRAGWLANAYYERSSHSLQFFSFVAGRKTIHTSLSRDIVAHETAHALIDGIDPDLYDALDGQSLALHEGIADLTAMLMAFDSNRLRGAILTQTGGSIEKSTSFSSIGEQFGRAIDPTGRAGWLRSLLNDDRLDPDGDPADEPEAHELSQVISGVLYQFMCVLHAHFRKQVARRRGITEFSASGEALAIAAAQFRRMVLRGLDYLPPGEVTFADFGRAILAADQASFPDATWRRWLRDNFVRRGIVRTAADLDVRTNVRNRAIREVDLEGLVESPWVAYMFAEKNRDLLGIPADAQFEVLPRTVVNGRFVAPGEVPDTADDARPDGEPDAGSDGTHGEGAAGTGRGLPVRELLFKVRWSQTEPNPPDLGGSTTRRVQTGTTLVIDWNEQRIRSLLRPLDLEGRRRARDATLGRLMARGLVEVRAPDPEASLTPLPSGIDAVVTDGVLRVRQTARLLHIARDASDD
jgi:hypothetical protein